MTKRHTTRQGPSLAERAYRLIKQDIVAGHFRSGDVIAEGSMARRYDLGRTPIREALQGLQRDGLVYAIPRAGYEITSITAKDVQEIFQLRLMLEPAAAELAAAMASDEDLERLSEAADFEYSCGDPESEREFLNANAHFHHMVALCSANKRLSEIVLQLLVDLERLFHLDLDIAYSAEWVVERRAMVEAVAERNPAKARELMAEQIRRDRDQVVQAMLGA